MVWSTISREDLQEAEADPNETEGIIDDLLTNAPGAEVIFLIKYNPEYVSVSMRSTGSAIDVGRFCAENGGGGHARAAGFKVRNGRPFDQVASEAIAKVRKFQAERLNIHPEDLKKPVGAPPESSSEEASMGAPIGEKIEKQPEVQPEPEKAPSVRIPPGAGGGKPETPIPETKSEKPETTYLDFKAPKPPVDTAEMQGGAVEAPPGKPTYQPPKPKKRKRRRRPKKKSADTAPSVGVVAEGADNYPRPEEKPIETAPEPPQPKPPITPEPTPPAPPPPLKTPPEPPAVTPPRPKFPMPPPPIEPV